MYIQKNIKKDSGVCLVFGKKDSGHVGVRF